MGWSSKRITGRRLLFLVASLGALQLGAEGRENGRGKTKIPGSSSVYLGQQTNTWKPLVKTTANLTDVRSIKSTFEFRTFDPEGVVFYGDNKNGDEWFVLSLKDGVPEMQICKADILISVAGGPKLNDGRWHLLELSSQGKFVILAVDRSNALVMGLQSDKIDEVITGQLRLALGGILIDSSKLIVPIKPEMDGCVRDGSWLNLTTPWEMVGEGERELRPCFHNIQRGSFFSGAGFAVFNSSVFPNEALECGIKIVLSGDFSRMDGTVLSIRAPGQVLMLSMVVRNSTEEILLSFGDDKIIMAQSSKRFVLTFHKDFLQVLKDDEDPSGPQRLSIPPGSQAGYLTTWREGRLAIGGLLGKDDDIVGTDFLIGCLETISVQEKNLDLDLADKHASVSSYSCPA